MLVKAIMTKKENLDLVDSNTKLKDALLNLLSLFFFFKFG